MTRLQRELRRIRLRHPEALDNERMWPRFIAAVEAARGGAYVDAVRAFEIGGPLLPVERFFLLLCVSEVVGRIQPKTSDHASEWMTR